MDLSKLREPFRLSELEWKVFKSGIADNNMPWARVFAFVSSRAIMDRLDEVCGPENWQTHFHSDPELNGTICNLSIKIDDHWIKKEDGSNFTKLEPFKGGLTGAFKRVAAQWGIGRYLYDCGELWADFSEVYHYTNGAKYISISGHDFYYLPPNNMPMKYLHPDDQKKRRDFRKGKKDATTTETK